MVKIHKPQKSNATIKLKTTKMQNANVKRQQQQPKHADPQCTSHCLIKFQANVCAFTCHQNESDVMTGCTSEMHTGCSDGNQLVLGLKEKKGYFRAPLAKKRGEQMPPSHT